MRPKLWQFERRAVAMGYQVVAGVDDVGMGPLAGPVVGGAVVLRIGDRIPGLNDSKLMTAEERDQVDAIIRRRAVAVAVCAVDHTQVDRLGLFKARILASAGAVAGLAVKAEYLLIDAFDIPDAPLPQIAVVRGDKICASIMAARIVELELICRRGRELVVVEVKTRSSDAFGTPLEAVGSRKRRALRAAAAEYRALAEWRGPIRFAVVGVTVAPDGSLAAQLIED